MKEGVISINFNSSYIGQRDDILTLIPDNISKALDIGCSTGALGEQIKQKNSNVEVLGLEFDEQMATVAKKKLDKVIVGGIENINLADFFHPNYFDCIIFADILEHLKTPLSSKVTNRHVLIAKRV